MNQDSQPSFVHLHVHSAYSLLEGALPVAALTELAAREGMVALAITDRGNLFGALEFSEKIAGSGIQPIIGCNMALEIPSTAVADERFSQDGANQPDVSEIVLLVKDETGYQNLMKLTSAAFLEQGSAPRAFITFERLAAHCEGLILLTGGPDGPIDKALLEQQDERAAHCLQLFKDCFGDRVYVELQRHNTGDEKAVEPRLIALAYEYELPLVATNEVYFSTSDDYEAHDALLCIAEGRYVSEDDRRRVTPEHGFKTAAEMAALFGDIPEAVSNTVEITQRCCYRPLLRDPILPQYLTATADQSAADTVLQESEELKRQAETGLANRLKLSGPASDYSEQDYWDRLAFELNVITQMKYPGYFLIVADFIKWAKAQDIPVGPGRGSGAGSVVAWALTVTDLDPLRFGLLFERFLNPERVSMPDFDIDFCQERRDEVIKYVQNKYGSERVAQIITFGKLQARAVLRDVGRVLQMPYGQVDTLCKLVPNNPANPLTLEEAIDEEPRLQDARDGEEIVAKLLDIGQRLEGLYRHASTHAAGIVIADRPLTDLVPLYQDQRSELPATQFNMKWVEPAGLVKFDFLGLKTLTVIEKAIELVAVRGTKIDLAGLALDDEATFELLARADTAGVFQLESTGMRDSLRRLKPDRFEDIIAMVALYRPGPMDNIPSYISRKHGEEEVDYLHPSIEPLLKETYGVIIYQEQVMQIAQVLSGYSLGEADLLRRAMGKKIKEEMAQQKTRFVDGAIANGVAKAKAAFIFELVDKFAGYGFNKSHAAAYALLAYQTAYLKANHPCEFLAATMTLDLGNTDKLDMFVQEARSSGIEVLPPCINASQAEFLPEDGGIRYALAALKNIGRGAADDLVRQRSEGGAYLDLRDLAGRLDPKSVNKRSLETLAAAGAFDALEKDRAVVFANVEHIIAHAQRIVADREAGQNDLFSSGAETGAAPLDIRSAKPWRPIERLKREFEAVGLYLTGHPLDEYKTVCEQLDVKTWVEFEAELTATPVTGALAGTVTSCKERRSRKGNRFAFASFSDQTGQFEALLFSEQLSSYRELLEAGKPVLVRVEASREEDSVKLRALTIESLERLSGRQENHYTIVLDQTASMNDIRDVLRHEGRCRVTLQIQIPDKAMAADIRLPGNYDLSPDVAGHLQVLPGVIAVQMTPG